MKTIEIKNRFTNETIHSGTFENLKECVEDAVEKGVSLSGADLRGADLKGINLRGADLSEVDLYEADLSRANLSQADLSRAKNYYSFVAFDTSKRLVHCVKNKDTWMIKAGCFWGTLEELEAKVKKTHNSKVYLANIEILKGIQ